VSKTKPTAKELHNLCETLGIRAIAGKPLSKLIEEALASDDPRGYLELYAPGPIETEEGQNETKQAAAETIPAVNETNPPRPATTHIVLASLKVPYLRRADETTNAIQGLHLDVQLRNQKTARAFRAFHAGLLKDAAKLANGRYVESFANAVEWLIEQLAGETEDSNRSD
jgi:hypothetical protein